MSKQVRLTPGVVDMLFHILAFLEVNNNVDADGKGYGDLTDSLTAKQIRDMERAMEWIQYQAQKYLLSQRGR